MIQSPGAFISKIDPVVNERFGPSAQIKFQKFLELNLKTYNYRRIHSFFQIYLLTESLYLLVDLDKTIESVVLNMKIIESSRKADSDPDDDPDDIKEPWKVEALGRSKLLARYIYPELCFRYTK